MRVRDRFVRLSLTPSKAIDRVVHKSGRVDVAGDRLKKALPVVPSHAAAPWVAVAVVVVYKGVPGGCTTPAQPLHACTDLQCLLV